MHNEGLKLMVIDGIDHSIRCRFISNWFKAETYVPSKEGLLSEIEKIEPDVIVIDLALSARIDGIDTTQKIRTEFNVAVWYE